MKTKIVIVLTSHNRKEKTINCIKAIIQSESVKLGKYSVEIVLCDDASTDGTIEAVEMFSDKRIHIVKGTGDLYWARGMAFAMKTAELFKPDFYLMVNDDVSFFPNMLDIMLNSFYSIGTKNHAIVGSTLNELNGVHTYGGWIWNGKGIGEQRIIVLPAQPCNKCNQANWNCFLIPRLLYESIGKIDCYYEHSWADFDYSNRIIKAGCDIYVANQYIGYCSRNDIKGTWGDSSLSFIKRIRAMHKKTGLPPKSHWYYCKKYYGKEAIFVFIRPYISLIKSALLDW